MKDNHKSEQTFPNTFLWKYFKTRKSYVVLFSILGIFVWLKFLSPKLNQSIDSILHNKDFKIDQDNPQLVEFVRKEFIIRYAAEVLLQTQHETENQRKGKGIVDYLIENKIIDDKNPGYFVEVGANNGLKFTSTLKLEAKGWSGLVVEGVASSFQKLMEIKRTAVLSNATISSKPYPLYEKFYSNPKIDLWGGLTYRFYKGTNNITTLLTIPLYTLMLAVEAPKSIDLLILDIEGSELDVLRTLPWDDVKVGVIVVETSTGKEGPGALANYLGTIGFSKLNIGSGQCITVPLEDKLLDEISSIITKTDVNSEYCIFKKVDKHFH